MTLLSIYTRFFFLSLLLSLGQSRTVPGTSRSGTDERNNRTASLYDNRRPSLYTKDFGDFLGNSRIDITHFDSALYKDNMTAVFNLQGHTSIENENLMSTRTFAIVCQFLDRGLSNACPVYVGLFAYGKNRFEWVFDPCRANIFRSSPPLPLNEDILVSNGPYIH